MTITWKYAAGDDDNAPSRRPFEKGGKGRKRTEPAFPNVEFQALLTGDRGGQA